MEPELEYLFRHVLVQDAAYASLLKQERRELHRRVADTLIELYPERRGELAGVIMGTGELHANQGGGGGHVANAGYMVHPDYQGKGVARSLCAYSLDAARAAGFRAMQFNAVVESNVNAVAAWQSLGFEVLATLPEAFLHPRLGYVGLHVMYRRL